MKMLVGRERTSPSARLRAGQPVVAIAFNLAAVLGVLVLVRLERSGSVSPLVTRSIIVPVVFADCVWTLAALTVPKAARVITRRGFHRIWIPFVLGAVILTGCSLAAWILAAIGTFGRARSGPVFYLSLFTALVIGVLIGGARYVSEGLKRRLQSMAVELRARELEQERALKLAAEARLSSLESRIHPHFLFNTLNSIASLVREDPSAAERLIQALSALLRFSLDSGQHAVPLGLELKIVTGYLEIEKARFGERLRYSVEIPHGLEATPVPPLSVQTLVENSLKYAVSNRREGGQVLVAARTDGQSVIIEVTDDGPGFSREAVAAGHGLDNLQARLYSLQTGAPIEISRCNGLTVVGFSVPRVQNNQDNRLASCDIAAV